MPARELREHYGLTAEQTEQRIRDQFRDYRATLQHLLAEYRIVDVARKVVGVGSVGTRATGRAGATDDAGSKQHLPGLDQGAPADSSFYWRQLRDMKGSALVELMSRSVLQQYAGLCGWTLARAHARSGDRVAIAEYLGTADDFDLAITDFAQRYIDQNE